MDALPKYETSLPKVKKKGQTKLRTRKVRQPLQATSWTFADKVPYILAIGALFIMSALVVFIANANTTLESQLSAVNTKSETVRQNNNNAKQKISNLTSADRLDEIAQKYGLTLENDSIRNVK